MFPLRTLGVVAVLAVGMVGLVASPTHAAWPDGWTHRIPFTADPNLIVGPDAHVDFPLLLLLNATDHADVFAMAKADGTDLLVTGPDGDTPLAREVVTYDATEMTAEIWVRVPSFSREENVVYLYFGNPTADLTAPASDTWNSNYRAVYHFADDPGAGTLTDSSPAGAHATLDPARWQSSDVTDGVLSQAWTFNGTTSHIATNDITTQSGNYTIEGWLFNTTRGTDFFCHTTPGFWHVSSQNQSGMGADFADGNLAAGWDPRPIPLDLWHHFAWSFDADNDTIVFYYNGKPQPLLGTSPPDRLPLYTGEPMNPDGTNAVGIVGPMAFIEADLHTGAADEFRVHEGVLSQHWMLTQFYNQIDPPTFFTSGPTQTFAGHSSVGRLKALFSPDQP